MNVSILNIGDELLIGQVVNTNAARMAQMLNAAGMEVVCTSVIGDNRDDIVASLQAMLASSDAVLMTGGLGPTKDDITKHVLCDFFGGTLVENEEALANVRRLFECLHYEVTPLNRQQAWVPDCCTVLNNSRGTAPGMWFVQHDTGKVVVSLPGVPYEMEGLMVDEVVPRLRAHFQTSYVLHKNILVQGIGESFLSDLVEPWEKALPSSIRLAYLPQAGMVKLRLTARGDDREVLERQISDALSGFYPLAGQYVVGEDFETLAEAVASCFTQRGLTLATAESCTGGTIASRLTALAGASAYFRGGVVAYSNEVKECALGVSHETLLRHGAVSEETVREMAEGVRQRLEADYGVATSGIAGPTGGTADKPVGTVWMAVATPQGVTTRVKQFGNDRQRVIERATNEVMSMLLHALAEN